MLLSKPGPDPELPGDRQAGGSPTRRGRPRRLLGCLTAAALASGLPTPGTAQEGTLERWLRDEGGFTNSNVRDLRSGSPVVRLVGPDGPRVIGFLGAVRVATTPAHLLALANRPADLLMDRSTMAVGEVDIPPRFGDFRDLRVPLSDVRELRVCSPGDCKVKLPSAAIQELVGLARAPNGEAVANVTAHVRSMLFDYADRFVREGLTGLPAYGDKPESVSPIESLAPLRALDGSLFGQSRVLTNHLRRYPESSASGVTDRLAWIIEDVGLRPTIRLLHLSLIQPPDVPAVDAIVGIEQLYASHYLAGSTTFLSLIVDTSITGEPARYLVMLTRYLFDEEVDGVGRAALRRSMLVDQNRRLLTLQQRLRP